MAERWLNYRNLTPAFCYRRNCPDTLMRPVTNEKLASVRWSRLDLRVARGGQSIARAADLDGGEAGSIGYDCARQLSGGMATERRTQVRDVHSVAVTICTPDSRRGLGVRQRAMS
jgi:hypothetical protein